MSVDDFARFLNGDISMNDLQNRLVGNGVVDATPAQPVTQSPAATSHFADFLNGNVSMADLHTQVDRSFDSVGDVNRDDRQTGLYDAQRADGTHVGINEENMAYRRSSGADIPQPAGPVFDSVADSLSYNLNNNFDPVADMNSYNMSSGSLWR